MFIDFDKVFNPTEEEKFNAREFINNMIRESLKNNGECCCNCKHCKEVYCGHGWMHAKCSKTRKWIEEDIKCEHYEFQGFLKEE